MISSNDGADHGGPSITIDSFNSRCAQNPAGAARSDLIIEFASGA
jgi:hypothetical protein